MSEPTPIVVPHSGVVESVYIIEWLKAAGDHVEEGEEVVLVESEKAEGAIEAPASGTLEILIDTDPEEDVEVEVGTTIGRVLP
jgi:pyruvate/2-oxoglutarate dehydrogenase complex dihydrolipoamide acyltransferase (E2) component